MMPTFNFESLNLTTFVLVALAVYRLSHMVTSEEGPFEAFAKMRDALGGNQQATWIGRGIVCILCVSFWVGILGAVALWFWQVVAVKFAVYALALSGATLAFKKWTKT